MFFKTREQREIEALTKRLVKTICQSDTLKELIVQAKKQIELEQFTQNGVSYPIIRDLINSAAYGVFIDLTLPDGSKMVFKKDPNALSEAEKEHLERLKRDAEKDLY